MTAHDCAHQGHVWAEGQRPEPKTIPDGGSEAIPPVMFRRHRGRPPGKVAVYCLHCHATTELEASAGFTRGGPASPAIGKTIPPQFKKVLDRALEESATTDTGPARPQ